MDVPPGSGVLRFGELALDLATGELRRPGDAAPTVLGARPTRLLALLAWHHGQLVTRDDIQSYVWSDGTTVDFDQSINQHIRQLRHVLGDNASHPAWIQTLPARGYRFLVAATQAEPALAPPAVEVEGTASEARASPPVVAVPDGGSDSPVPSEQMPARPLLGSRRRRMGAAALVASAFAGLLLTTSNSGSVAPVRLPDPAAPVRLAVLPLDSEPADQDRATAAAEELIAALGEAYAPTLEVIALRSVMQYRGTASTPSAIARELGVDYVLEGRVRTQPDRARVTLALVRGRDSTQVWTHTFEQSQHTWTTEAVMAQDVAAALGRVLLPHRARPDAALDIDAQQDMLRGRYLLPRAPRKAAQAFAAVTARVPRSARAWAALGTAELRTSYRRSAAAAAAADKALALDPAQPEAHFVRAVTAFYGEWNPERARQHLMAAIAANPAFAEAHHTLAAAYSAAGRHDEAIAAVQRAFALDPLAPEVVSDVGWYYYFARRYTEAAAWCRRTLAIDPHFYWAHRCIVMSRMRQGDTPAAVAAALDDVRARGAGAEVIDAVTARGLPAYWAWERDRIEPESNGDYCDRAVADLALGDTARALDDLEHGVHDRHDWLLPFLAVDPTFDPLRGQPRFDAILRTIAAGASL